ncbi:MAG: hypothetical protein FJ026_05605, partial [Chloroflexi bacterium]|nr:hypothetical protein [Chloroflexota bacterium]
MALRPTVRQVGSGAMNCARAGHCGGGAKKCAPPSMAFIFSFAQARPRRGGGNMAPMAEWTFMVYLAGDNNLSDAGDTDLAEMRAVGSTDKVHIVAEFDNAGRRGTRRYHIQRDGVKERVESLGETDSGDPQVLLNFVDWAAANFKARRYALILWNHGGGWEPAEVDRLARRVRARDYSVREASERSASPLGRIFFRSTLEKI